MMEEALSANEPCSGLPAGGVSASSVAWPIPRMLPGRGPKGDVDARSIYVCVYYVALKIYKCIYKNIYMYVCTSVYLYIIYSI